MIFKNKKNTLFLILIFLISFFFRFYKTNTYPTLLLNEATIGYNAYSLLETGFENYKPELYVYLTIPFIKIFGLNTIATRLPSILLGSFLPILLYFLIKEINQKAHKTAIIAAIIATINPYLIHFSRGAWETNVLTFELVLASYLFFKYINKKLPRYLFLSILVFGLTFFTYQDVLTTSLFSYSRSSEEIQTITNETNQIDYQLFYNQPMFFLRNFLSRYFNYFSPRFLTFEGDWQNPLYSTPYFGVLLYPSLIFLFIGIFFAFTRNKKENINYFFLFWLLVSPIPSALTRDSIQSAKTMSLSIPLIYFTALGIYAFFQKFNSKILKTLIIFSYLISFIYYGDLYLNHMVQKNPIDFLYGYKQAITYLIKNQNRFQKIYMTDYYSQPDIYYLFYSQYSPSLYQQQANSKIKTIDNIYFETVQYNFIKDRPNTMSIFSQEEIYRQGIDKTDDFKNFIPLSPIGNISSFYAYENP